MHHPNRNRSAFTLIELMVVIVVIAILLAIGSVVINKMKTRAKRTGTLSQIAQLYTGIESYKAEYGYYPIPQENSQGNFYISKGTDIGTILDDEMRKHFTYDKEKLENDHLLDEYGEPLIYMYTPFTGSNPSFVNISMDGNAATSSTAIQVTHSIFIYSYGADGEISPTTPERNWSDDPTTANTDADEPNADNLYHMDG
ncbi:MAG: type II secretion system protein [Planctomycetota bacterium]|jgi:prepilin-type N-terminal cleavage/methylation domain-containing protein